MDLIDNAVKDNDYQKVHTLCDIQGLDDFDSLLRYLMTQSPSSTPPSSTPTIVVKPLCNWTTSEKMCEIWNRMSEDGHGKWKNIQLDPFTKDPDYFLVVNGNTERIVFAKTILFRMEPYIEKRPEMWGQWSNIDPNILFWYGGHDKELNVAEWWISKTYTELSSGDPIHKQVNKYDHRVSAILTEKYNDPGHIKRIDFVKFLESKNLQVDVFGSKKGHEVFSYASYKGPLPPYQKDDGLFPYKYTIAVENNMIDNYCTEKLWDGILSECLVFYFGCENLREYIDPKSYVFIDLNNFESAYRTIVTAMCEDWWSQRLPYIIETKHQILNKFQVFPKLETIIHKH